MEDLSKAVGSTKAAAPVITSTSSERILFQSNSLYRIKLNSEIIFLIQQNIRSMNLTDSLTQKIGEMDLFFTESIPEKMCSEY
jgi:hypothetical protein